MKKLSAFIAAAGLATSGFAAAAPVEMTDQQMDNVTAGALIEVVAIDVVDIEKNNVAVAVPVNAAVAVSVLGVSGAAAGQRPGNLTQRQ
jgi:hypothetical protein